MLFYYQAAVTIFLSLLLLNLVNNLRLLKKPSLDGELPSPAPKVSVLIPARDEERNIGSCLSSLLNQHYPDMEVLVLDDHSSDGTGEIVARMAASDSRLRFLRGKPLPPGWHGKAFACYQLAQAAGGDWYLFVDADTFHSPLSVLAAIKSAIQEGADLLSFFPHIVAKTFWEKIILPIIPFGVLSFLPLRMMATSPDPRIAMALGPYMVFRRDFYWQIGGHRAVRDNIVDDVGLAREVKEAGGRVVLMDGSDIVSVRFYRGLREIWQGLTKSTFAALDNSLRLAGAFLVIGACLFIVPYWFVFRSLRAQELTLLSFWLPSLHIIMISMMYYKVVRRFSLPMLAVFLNLITIAVVLLIIINSVRCTLFGKGVVWKGRYYPREIL
ncbi:MAG: glycosyl hydrolase [Chloroflexi bacterium]|nr:MAG: glycosyl hydrolase [Chloroflexota bacterium]HDN79382.1 glycosyltransferase [Chloroflexota bacterium]